jgi:hypothetical protein
MRLLPVSQLNVFCYSDMLTFKVVVFCRRGVDGSRCALVDVDSS